MQTHPILLLTIGLTLAACDDSGGPSDGEPPTEGTLVVSTATGGSDPDQDGYLLTVDGVDSVALDPTGTAEVDLPGGRYTLRLLGVAEHCSVAPGTPLEVDVPLQDTTSVAFEVNCPLTGARITTTTTGSDLDPNGYRVEVDRTDRGVLPLTGLVTIRLAPGTHAIALTGLSPNCAIVGPSSHTVTIMHGEVAPLAFAAACTATSGVVAVVVEASGPDTPDSYTAMLDGVRSIFARPSEPAYLAAVPAGDHVVSLIVPNNCSVEGDTQFVAVTVGGLIRDTVEVTFSVTCVSSLGTLRITAPTTGPVPAEPYRVEICTVRYDCIFYGTWEFLGALDPNDTLVRSLQTGRYQLRLRDVPAKCSVRPSILSRVFTITNGTTDIDFKVRCRP